MRTTHRTTGFTILEIIVSVGILALTSYIVITVFTGFNREQALLTESDRVSGVLAEARSLTLFSQNATQYGVHFNQYNIVLFNSAVYDPATTTNVVLTLNALVQVATTSLAGGGSDVVFDRLTGDTSQSGSVTLNLRSGTSTSKAITIYPTGIAERR